MSGFPLSDKKEDERYIGDAIGCPLNTPNGFAQDVGSYFISFLGSYYYSGPSDDLSLPIPFTAGNYACHIFFAKSEDTLIGYLYMAPVETMAFKVVAYLEFSFDNEIWNVTPVN